MVISSWSHEMKHKNRMVDPWIHHRFSVFCMQCNGCYRKQPKQADTTFPRMTLVLPSKLTICIDLVPVAKLVWRILATIQKIPSIHLISNMLLCSCKTVSCAWSQWCAEKAGWFLVTAWPTGSSSLLLLCPVFSFPPHADPSSRNQLSTRHKHFYKLKVTLRWQPRSHWYR